MRNSDLTLRVVKAFLKGSGLQLDKGRKVEKEHDDVYSFFEKFLKKNELDMPLSRKEFYEMIAKAHIRELRDYYTQLEKIEPSHKEAMDFTGIAPLITPDKKLTDSEIARALRLSIAAELDAAHLYELIADAVSDQKVQQVMREVANEEKVHVGEFTELLEMFDKEYKKSVEDGRKEVTE